MMAGWGRNILWTEVQKNKLPCDGTVLLCVQYSKCNRMLKYNIVTIIVKWVQSKQDMRAWTELIWQALENVVMKLQVLHKARNFFTSWMTISFWRRTLLHGLLIAVPKIMCLSQTSGWSYPGWNELMYFSAYNLPPQNTSDPWNMVTDIT
jgi:hypothetical protein